MTPRVRARRAVATNFQFVSTIERNPGLSSARRGPASPHTPVFSQTGWKPIPRAVATNFQFVSTIECDPGLSSARRGPASVRRTNLKICSCQSNRVPRPITTTQQLGIDATSEKFPNGDTSLSLGLPHLRLPQVKPPNNALSILSGLLRSPGDRHVNPTIFHAPKRTQP